MFDILPATVPEDQKDEDVILESGIWRLSIPAGLDESHRLAEVVKKKNAIGEQTWG